MSVPIIYKGQDEIIQLTLTESGGSAITISILSDVIISVYQTKDDIIQQWKISNSSLIVISDAGGIVVANLDRDNLMNIPLKRLFFEIAVIVSNSDFEDGIQKIIKSDIVLADLKNSVS